MVRDSEVINPVTAEACDEPLWVGTAGMLWDRVGRQLTAQEKQQLVKAIEFSTIPEALDEILSGMALSAADLDQVGDAESAEPSAPSMSSQPPNLVSPYYRVEWVERRVESHQTIVTAAELAGLAGTALDGPHAGVDVTSDAPSNFMFAVSTPTDYQFADNLAHARGDTASGEVDDLDRYDIRITPLTAAEALAAGRPVWPLYCYKCGARVSWRATHYVHDEQGRFDIPPGLPPSASDTEILSLRETHAAGRPVLDEHVAEDDRRPTPR